MLGTYSLKNRRPFAVAERVAGKVGSDTAAISMAYEWGSNAQNDAQRAGEFIGLALFFLEITADSLLAGRTRPFFRAMTPETGERAAVWLAHCLGRRFPEAPERPGFDEAYRVLCETFPLPSGDEMTLQAIIDRGHDEYGFDPRNIYPELSYYAMSLVLGERDTRFRGLEGGSEFTDRYLDNLTFQHLWGAGGRLHFRLVDPAGYESWAAGRGIRDPLSGSG